MRWSQIFIPTLRDNPAGPLSPARKLLIRAGYLRSAGYLPLGQLALTNMQKIAREELATLGAAELQFPAPTAIPAMRELARSVAAAPRVWYRMAAQGSDGLSLDTCAFQTDALPAAIDRILFRCGIVAPAFPPLEVPLEDPEGDLALEPFATPDCGTIAEVAEFTGLPATTQMKSLVMVADGQPVLALIRGDHHLSRPKLGLVLHAEDIRPATATQIQDWFGAEPGSLGPVGVTQVRILADAALMRRRNMISGANRTGFHLRNVTPGRDFDPEYYDLRDGDSAGPLRTSEVAYLGEPACGINFDAILRNLADRDSDADGLALPPSVAPFTVVITPVNNGDAALREAATALYGECRERKIPVLYDDRDERPGVKFKDADLIGIPWRITVGPKKLALGQVEVYERRTRTVRDVALAEATDNIN